MPNILEYLLFDLVDNSTHLFNQFGKPWGVFEVSGQGKHTLYQILEDVSVYFWAFYIRHFPQQLLQILEDRL